MAEAVIKTGGKQYLVKKGDVIKIEKINKKEGAEVSFKDVLLFSDSKGVKVGKPKVAGAKVTGEVLKQAKDKKVTIIKYKRKTRYRRKQGHRQFFTQVKITAVS